MSIEIYVLSDRQLASIAEWQQAIDREGFALRLSTQCPFEALRGHLPAQWGDKHAGFECDHWKGSEVIDESPDVEFGRRWEHALAFRFGGDFGALLGAYAAAAAYARATDGVVFDGESGEVLTPEKAAQTAREFERGPAENGIAPCGRGKGAARDQKNLFSGRGRPRFSRKVLPS
jgi:hypothetical protein